jgi:PPOX class probable F420-dependent enzyme
MEYGFPGLKRQQSPKGPSTMTDLPAFEKLASADQGLVVFTTLRRDGSAQSSVVNAGVLPHPLTGEPVVGLVAIGGARKLAHLRADPRTTVTARNGWQWATVEGTAQLIGPDDPHPDVDAERLRVMLREIFTAAGGTHDDWDTYDRVMREQRRTAVLITPVRVYSNPSRG